MAKKNAGLGRGLSAILGEVEEAYQNNLNDNSGLVVEIEIDKIKPNPLQPRKVFDNESLQELAASIQEHGLLQPILVYEDMDNSDEYFLIAGERRLRASKIAHKESIKAIIVDVQEEKLRELALIENIQREDLNPIEAAKAIRELMTEYNFTQETVADRIGKSRPLVANTLRLLSLTPEVIAMIESNKISAGHGKCLVAVEDKQKQIELAKMVVENKLTVRDLENIIRNDKPSTKTVIREKIIQSVELKELGHRMQRLFRTKVKIVGDDKKGKISIAYFNQDDLDRICSFIDKLER